MLENPYHYILKLVQWGVASGATRVEIDTDRNSIRLRHDGSQLTQEELEYAWGAENVGPGPLRHLWLGLQAARELGPSFFRVRSDNGGLEWGDTPVAQQHPPGQHEIQVGGFARRPRPPRFGGPEHFFWGHIFQIFPNLFNELKAFRQDEFGSVRAHCQLAPIPIVVNGWPVNRPYFGCATLRYKLDSARLHTWVSSMYLSCPTKHISILSNQAAPDLVLCIPNSAPRGSNRFLTIDNAETTTEGIACPYMSFQGRDVWYAIATAVAVPGNSGRTRYQLDGVELLGSEVGPTKELQLTISARGLEIDHTGLRVLDSEKTRAHVASLLTLF
jgi:hypothetical protein